MNYSNVKNPQFSSLDNSTIDCLVTFDTIGEVPFTASPTDSMDYGRQIFAQCLAGDYGPVSPYVPPHDPEVVA